MRKVWRMSTLEEIQVAISNLPEDQRHALSVWLRSQEEPELSAEDEELLSRAVEEGIRDADAGRVTPIEEVRSQVKLWARGK